MNQTFNTHAFTAARFTKPATCASLVALLAAFSGLNASAATRPLTRVAPATVPIRQTIANNGWAGAYANLPAPSIPLLYLSDFGSDKVFVYKYTNPLAPVLTQTLTGFPHGLQAECINATGDVYIAAGDISTGVSNIIGYHHGALTSFVTLSDVGFYPVGCAFNRNGDLAVANLMAYPGNGDVAIYPNATAPATHISSPFFNTVEYLGYDPRGNLWIDGTNPKANHFQYGEIALSNPAVIVPKTLQANITIPGNVQWDGQHMTVGNRTAPSRIYRVNPNGSTAGVTVLSGTNMVAQSYISGGRIIAPDYPNGRVRTYSYPGGALLLNATGFGGPAGAVISP